MVLTDKYSSLELELFRYMHNVITLMPLGDSLGIKAVRFPRQTKVASQDRDQ